jgi:hypothetical protein
MPLPSSSAAHRLGPAVESHNPGARPLPDGAARWVSQWSIRLPHRLLRSGGGPESKGSASLEGSTNGGGGAARDAVGEVGSMVAVCGANGPWDWPRGPTVMRVVRRIIGAPTGPVTTVMWRSSSSSSPPSSSSP